VAAIATAHGGRAAVSTRPQGGALFRIELPLLEAPVGRPGDAALPTRPEAQPVSQARGSGPDTET